MSLLCRLAHTLCPRVQWPVMLEEFLHISEDGDCCYPAVAGWLFLVAVINLSFPRLLPYICRHIVPFIQFILRAALAPVLLKCVWGPVNRMLHCVVQSYNLPRYVKRQWLTFLPVAVAVLALLASLRYTGNDVTLTRNTSKRQRHRSRKAIASTHTLDVKFTRSGHVYGKYL